MRTAEVREERRSSTWDAALPGATLVLATHERAAWLAELLARLDDQLEDCEVVVADDGSDDGTWQLLAEWTARTRVPAAALRLTRTGGPSVPRNTAAARARGDVLLLTDDDCLPDPDWHHRMRRAGRDALVQGRTLPLGERAGAWDRTIQVEELSGLWESCNLALPRQAFLEAGGFPVRDLLGPGGRGFGEDVLLGAAVARRLPVRFQAEAVVRHRWVPGTFRDQLDGRWRLRGFPALVAEVPELRETAWHDWFLSRRTAAVDLAVTGLVLHRPVALLPWMGLALRDARSRPGPLRKRLPQVLVSDAVAAAALTTGSLRNRALLL